MKPVGHETKITASEHDDSKEKCGPITGTQYVKFGMQIDISMFVYTLMLRDGTLSM